MYFRLELTGFNDSRSYMLANTINKQLSTILGNSKFTRVRAYKELGIPSVYEYGTYMRLRAYSKFQHSKGHIRQLIENPIKSRQKTWVSVTKTWIKRNKIDYSTKKMIKNNIKKPYEIRQSRKKMNKTTVFIPKLSTKYRKIILKKRLNG